MRYLRLDFATNCNLRCIMCQAYNSVPKSQVAFTDFERFVMQTRGQLADWSHIQLGNQAEPLIHPRFAEFLKFIRAESKAVIHVVTNGKLLDRYAQLLNETGNCLVQVSLDSVTKATHEYIRQGSQFEQTVANLGLLDTGRTQVLLSFTLMNSNIGEYGEMVRFCQERGYRISAFPMFVREEQNVLPYNLLTESLWFNLDRLKGWLREFYGKDYDQRVIGSAAGATAMGLSEFNCTAHVEDLTIDGKGQAILCGQARLGNLAERGLSELWLSPPAQAFRRAVDHNRGPCLKCNYRERCLAPSMSRLENHMSEAIATALSAGTKHAIGFDRAISDAEALDRFVADLGGQLGIFDIQPAAAGFTARRVRGTGRSGEPLLEAPSRYELHEKMCRSVPSQDIPLLLQQYGTFNLVAYKGDVYALSLRLGPVDLTSVTQAQLELWESQQLCLRSSRSGIPEASGTVGVSRAASASPLNPALAPMPAPSPNQNRPSLIQL